MKLDADVLQIFREESEERLDRMVERLLSVESGSAPPDVIDALFRDAHSIKGNAGMVGFDEIRVVAHTMEDLLGQARDDGELPAAAVEPLLQAADAIRRGLAGGHGVAGDVVERLAAAAPREKPPAAPEPAVEPTAAPAPPGAAADAAPVERRSMRVDSDKVDRLLDAIGETGLHHRRLQHLLGPRLDGDEDLEEELGHGDALLDELQDSVLRLRTLPLRSITGPFPRAVRDLALAQGKDVELTITGADTQLDRVILDGISQTVAHLLRNAVSHGIELPAERERAGKPPRGRIALRAAQRASMAAIEVADDGRGVSPELLERAREAGSLTAVLAAPGFSTAGAVTEASGRGVGLDAVKRHVESLGGSLEVRSEPGDGTSVLVLLPLSLALLRVLLVERAGQAYAIPLLAVEEVVNATGRVSVAGTAALPLRGSPVPLADLADVMGAAAADLDGDPPAVVVTSSEGRAAAMCDRLLGEQEVLVKTLGLLAGVSGYLGVSILGDGRIALVVDPAFLARGRGRGRIAVADPVARPAPARVLVADDQFTVRELQRSILEASGYEVVTARDGREALDAVARDPAIELVVTDVQMPELDGFGVLEALRADERFASLPVVVVTSLGSDEHRRRGAELGADAYVVKESFDQQALLETVRQLVGR